jgi:CubicO group peptidase (beta-lactamase class C family)
MSMTTGLSTDGAFEAPAGERWAYNTNVYSRLVPVLEQLTGLGISELTERWLTGPVGMAESGWAERPWAQPGQDANRIGLRSSARDLARFGLLVLADGHWGEVDVLGDPGYLDLALTSSQELNPSYGLLWWLNGQQRLVRGAGRAVERSLVPTAPADLVAGQGALTRLIYVVPSLRLVVTRTGDQPPDGAEFGTRLWQLLMRAVPAG